MWAGVPDWRVLLFVCLFEISRQKEQGRRKKIIYSIFYNKNKKMKEESYDGNSLNNNLWTMTSFFIFAFFSLIMILVIIQFSFSNTFSQNLYMYFAIIQISMISAEFTLEILSSNVSLIFPLSSSHGKIKLK